MIKPLLPNTSIRSLHPVGQQLPTLLTVTCCVRWHTLLHVVAMLLCVVGSCFTNFETGQTFSHVHIGT